MKQNKVFCDICGHDIELEKDMGIAMFSHITVMSALNLNHLSVHAEQDKKLAKKEIDICEVCAKKLEEYIKTITKK